MRKKRIKRKTKETDITININLDGSGRADIKTPIPFMTHMLEIFAAHSLFDLNIKVSGDIDVDDHHTVEDLGITLGTAISNALKTKKGIRRFGEASVPLDSTLARAVIDFSGRPYLVLKGKIPRRKIKTFDPLLVRDFLQGFVSSSQTTLHIDLCYADNAHHALECIFKSLARACGYAVIRDSRIKGVRSSKGSL